ncbi:MAG: ABC transporter family substrate-binding protein [Cryobacterium sp.]|nr:ABC transporter family substrate-binding protein [Cryobacterium sp.]
MPGTASRVRGPLAIALASSLVLSACTNETPDNSNLVSGSSVSVMLSQELFSMNDRTSYGDSPANTQILEATSSKFFSYDSKSELVADTSFGTAEVLSNDPLIVKYTIAPGVTWSDGVPVDASDLLLAWAANSGMLNTPEFDDSGYVNPETGQYSKAFPDSVVYFDGATSEGLQFVSTVPKLSKDLRSLTLTWDQYFVDWPLSLEVGLPAHVVARMALGLPIPKSTAKPDSILRSATKAKALLVKAVQDREIVKLSKIANSWNSGFNLDDPPKDPGVFISNGPYTVASFNAGSKLVLKANLEYHGERQPKFETINVQFEADPLRQAQALEQGAVDVISPPFDSEVSSELSGLANFNLLEGDAASFEHFDFRVGGPNYATLKDPRVRKAFLMTIPRNEIRQAALGEAASDTDLPSSIVFSADDPGYDVSINTNGSEMYLQVNIEGARSLLSQAGVSNPTVCILYDPSSPRRQEEFRLVASSASKAGFVVTDCSSPDWFSLLDTPGSSDASIFSWQVRNTSFSGLQSIFVTNGKSNFSGLSDPKVDEILAKMSIATDAKQQLSLRIELDSELFDYGYGLRLFQFRHVVAFDSKVTGVALSPLSTGIFWNVEDWNLATSTSSPAPVK